MRPPSLYPQRVPPHLIVQQQQVPPVGRGSPASRLRAEHSMSRPPAALSDDSMEDSSSELSAGKEVRTLQLQLGVHRDARACLLVVSPYRSSFEFKDSIAVLFFQSRKGKREARMIALNYAVCRFVLIFIFLR